MATTTRMRWETRVDDMEPASSLKAEPPARRLPVPGIALGAAALLCLAWWATAAELLVGSARRESGRVLACRYLSGMRVVEWQYLDAARGTDERACPLVRFG